MRKKRSYTLVDKARDEISRIETKIKALEDYKANYSNYVVTQQKEMAEEKAKRAKMKNRIGYLKPLIDGESTWEKFKETYKKEKRDLKTLQNLLTLSKNFTELTPPDENNLLNRKRELINAKNNLKFEIEKNELRGHKKRAKELENASKLKAKEKKVQQTKAKASAFDNEIRRGTDTIKNSLKGQIVAHPYCPYCMSEITFSSCHADHIYPVNKGGLTTDGNMVLVCKTCNLKKRDLTLRQFCKNSNISYDEVCSRLEALHKDI